MAAAAPYVPDTPEACAASTRKRKVVDEAAAATARQVYADAMTHESELTVRAKRARCDVSTAAVDVKRAMRLLARYDTLAHPCWVGWVRDAPYHSVPLPARLWVEARSEARGRDPSDMNWGTFSAVDLKNVGHGSAAAHITLQTEDYKGYTPEDAARVAGGELGERGAHVWWRDLSADLLGQLPGVIKEYTGNPKGLEELPSDEPRDLTTFIEMYHLLGPSGVSVRDVYPDIDSDVADAEVDTEPIYPDDFDAPAYRQAWVGVDGFLCVPCPPAWDKHAPPALYA